MQGIKDAKLKGNIQKGKSVGMEIRNNARYIDANRGM